MGMPVENVINHSHLTATDESNEWLTVCLTKAMTDETTPPEHFTPWGLLDHCNKNYMDSPVWLRNTYIAAPKENRGFNNSLHDISKPMDEGNNERWLKNLGITATGKPLRRGPPTARQLTTQGRLILSEPSPSNKSRPPRGAAGHRGSHRLIQREPTGQTMTGKGTAFSVNTMEKAPLGNSYQDAVTRVGAKRGWRSERAVAKRQDHRSLSVNRGSRLLRRQTNELPGPQVATLAWGSKRIGDGRPDPSFASTCAAPDYQPNNTNN